jgi:fumarylacetoacetase
MLDRTHDADRRSWVDSANGHPDFPIQNLPLGVVSLDGGPPRGVIAIGDAVFDIAAALDAGLFDETARLAAEAAASPTLNGYLALGAAGRQVLRERVGDILDAASTQAGRTDLLHPSADCRFLLPARVGDYTDFYAGIHHATNAGRLFRPDNPLLPNYKYVPIGYHGRASSLVVSGTPVRRPSGQRNNQPGAAPVFGPSRRLDHELELAVWIGPGNALGEPIPIAEAAAHIAGFSLLNDWSARDIQAWEYQPLGPFLAKNFATTLSPWIVTPEALAPFRCAQPARPEGDPAPLDYLLDAADQSAGAINLTLCVSIASAAMRQAGLPPHHLTTCNARDLYWTVAQLVAHHTSGGCNLHAGDVFGTGTISSPTPDGFGSLLEVTEGGKRPFTLPSGESRTFLEDGDELMFEGHCHREGYASIGFGMCRGVVR